MHKQGNLDTTHSATSRDDGLRRLQCQGRMPCCRTSAMWRRLRRSAACHVFHQDDDRVIPELYTSTTLHCADAKRLQDVEGQNCIFEKNLLRFEIYRKKKCSINFTQLFSTRCIFPRPAHVKISVQPYFFLSLSPFLSFFLSFFPFFLLFS